MQAPVIVMNTNVEREVGRKAQISNITAAKTVADVIRTCLGPRSMLKMLLDPMGGVVLTNDGNAILREVEVAHPAAKSMIELSRTQDEEVGDGTTSVIILAGEVLAQALPYLEQNIHPIVIISAFKRALEDAIKIIDEISKPLDVENQDEMFNLVKGSIGTKFASRWSDLMCKLSLDAVRIVSKDDDGKREIDIKRYAKVEKVPGGEIEDSKVLDGIMVNKDVTHSNMRRRIENPRIVLLDCPLEYKKGESQTSAEVMDENHWNRLLQIEEEQIKEMCDAIISVKPDLVFTEKGVSDLAQHFLTKANISAIRRVRKTDNNRIARAVGATIVNRLDDLKEEDVGTGCGLFSVEKIGDEYFTFLTKCKNPKACTILLRGPSKDILNEIERNLQDAMSVSRNVFFNPSLAPGGGATEMAISVKLAENSKKLVGIEQWPYKAVAEAMEVIPRTLIQNCGGNPIKVLTELRAKHATGNHSWGIDGEAGTVIDMQEYGIWEPNAVKVQTIKTAIESACLLLRVDDIVSGVSKKKSGGAPASAPDAESAEVDEKAHKYSTRSYKSEEYQKPIKKEGPRKPIKRNYTRRNKEQINQENQKGIRPDWDKLGSDFRYEKKYEMYPNENEHVGEQLLRDQRKRVRKKNMAEKTAEEVENARKRLLSEFTGHEQNEGGSSTPSKIWVINAKSPSHQQYDDSSDDDIIASSPLANIFHNTKN
ncbi:21332_t:CDS:10 [Rhizophagus irregularis]|nr:21332_t:CDS:10 [Rhizophagus irregularis]